MGCSAVVRSFGVFLIVGLLAPAVSAQGTATVSGTVFDTNGGALPGVTVLLGPAAGGEQRSAVTDIQGQYSMTGLDAGTYQLRAVLSGFEPAEVEIELAAGAAATHDFTLRLASFYENITVTPQKREQQILDVPASISALTGESLEDQGVTSLNEIAASVPSLSIVETGPGTQRAQIRGISSPQNLPTVGLYLDEMPINAEAAGSGLDVRLLDLDRVEVLRGPQGTLYGEGSMGGTIKYITNDPEVDAFGLSFNSAYGTVTDGGEAYRASLVANLPIVEDVFAIRVVAGQERSPGWVDYPARGVEDGNEGDSTTFRIKGLWVVSDSLVASLMVQGQDSDYDDQTYADQDRTAPFVLAQPIKEESTAYNLVFNYDGGSFSMLSSTGFLDREGSGIFDFTALYLPVFDQIGFPPGTVDTVALTYGGSSEVLTQELRFASAGDRTLNWTAGAYYRRFEGDNFNRSVTTPNPLPFEVFVTYNEDTTEQFALFGELEYAFSEALTATVGLRYFTDDRERESSVGSFGPVGPNPDQSGSFDSINPRFVLSYRPADGKLFYLSAAKGFRSGGYNLVPPGCSIPNTFEPESLWTYEAGSSASLSSGKVVVQGAVYYNDWTDIQTLTLCEGSFVALTDNVGEATGYGVDLQLTITPYRGLRFTFTGNWNDSEYGTSSYAHSEGDQIDYAAEYNFGAALDWSFDWTEDLPGRLHIGYQETGPFDLNFRNFGVDPLSSDAITGLEARLGMSIGQIELTIFGRNLLDEDGAVSPAIPFGGVPSAVRLQPRTYGLGFGFRY